MGKIRRLLTARVRLSDTRKSITAFAALYAFASIGTAAVMAVQVMMGLRTTENAVSNYLPSFAGWTIAFIALCIVCVVVNRQRK